MAYQLERLWTEGARPALSADQLQRDIDRLLRVEGPRYRRLWAYCRNPMRPCTPSSEGGSDRPYRQAQEWGLPSRITASSHRREPFDAAADATLRKEVVIENDIGWRIETLVDYLFGQPLSIRSTAPQEQRRELLDRLAAAILEFNGGILFLQQLALLGCVYGFVDVLVKFSGKGGPPDSEPQGEGSPQRPARAADTSAALPDDPAGTGARKDSLEALIQRIARTIRLEIVEPARALPVLSPGDCRLVLAYAQVYLIERPASLPSPRSGPRGRWWQRLLDSAQQQPAPPCAGTLDSALRLDVITATRWQCYQDESLLAEGTNSLGQIPVVHIQNSAIPFEYSGASDVEPLIPLQDELNTRLSDRANRIALQSFKMYLGKGIEHFNELPVAPGRMWMTDNESASIEEFGGDASCPSESQHIADLREAMDKISGVSPIAAGAIKNRIGRLTSAAALRVTLMSLLARTERKRTSYGLGIQRMLALSLAWLDRAGLLATRPDERGFELHWPSPLPENDLEKLQEAEVKARLGVPRDIVLKELGY